MCERTIEYNSAFSGFVGIEDGVMRDVPGAADRVNVSFDGCEFSCVALEDVVIHDFRVSCSGGSAVNRLSNEINRRKAILRLFGRRGSSNLHRRPASKRSPT